MKKISFVLISLLATPFFVGCNKLSDPMPLADCDWNKINDVSKAGKASEWFKIGDTKKVNVNGLNHTVRIIDFNHDKDKDGKEIGITFEFMDVITNSDGTPTKTYWNSTTGESKEKNYDYRTSTLNNLLNDENSEKSIINLLPEQLRKVIKTVSKNAIVSETKDENYKITSFETKLFPLAHDELTIESYDPYVMPGEGTIYQYYKNNDTNKARVKYEVDYEPPAYGWAYWQRTPLAFYPGSKGASALLVGDDGRATLSSGVDYIENCIAPAFCI